MPPTRRPRQPSPYQAFCAATGLLPGLRHLTPPRFSAPSTDEHFPLPQTGSLAVHTPKAFRAAMNLWLSQARARASRPCVPPACSHVTPLVEDPR